MALEREIKLRFHDAGEARAKILALGATPLRSRRLQRDCLLDSADERLGSHGSSLRVRFENGTSLLTLKGPVIPGVIKIRDEHETVVGDGTVLLSILQGLGLRVWFRCEKYREEFAADHVVMAVDETPVGVFVEIEGSEAAIHTTARALGCSAEDYLTDSYRSLFLAHREVHGLIGGDMVFAGRVSE